MAELAHPDPPEAASAVHLRPEIVAQLRTEAQARGVSIAWMANKLLAEGLDRLLPAGEFRLTRDSPATSRPNPSAPSYGG